MARIYDIHDNGARPFRVIVGYIRETNKYNVDVYYNQDEYVIRNGRSIIVPKPPVHLRKLTVDDVFIGDKSQHGVGRAPRDEPYDPGNSLLIEVDNKYIYIGSEVYEFKTVNGEKINAYYSDIGNNDVPYPYAVSDDFVYLLLERHAVARRFFDMNDQIYKQYYDMVNLLDNLDNIPVNRHAQLRERKRRFDDLTVELDTVLLVARRRYGQDVYVFE